VAALQNSSLVLRAQAFRFPSRSSAITGHTRTVKTFLKRSVKQIIAISVIALSSTAGAQSIFDFSVWGAVQGSYAPLRGTASVGVGYKLPLGVGTVGLEVTPFGITSGNAVTNLFTVSAVLRDVPLPLTPISFRGDIGFEQTYGIDVSGTYSFFAGAGVRYQIFGPLGVTGGARVYLNNPNIFSILIGLDIVL
jgi:hypothetical protein